MSFIVQLWTAPAGAATFTSVKAAVEQLDAAFERPIPDARPMRAFTQALRDRFPAKVEGSPGLGIWSDASIDDADGESPLVLGVVTEHIDQALGVLAVLAPAHGVNLLDPQNAVAVRADGEIFSDMPAAVTLPALGRLALGDEAGAFERLLQLADRDNRRAKVEIAIMASSGIHVQRDDALAWALLVHAYGLKVADGRTTARDGVAAEVMKQIDGLRERLSPAACNRADGLLLRFSTPGVKPSQVIEAAIGERQVRYMRSLARLSAGDVARATDDLLSLAQSGHEPAQRQMAVLWAQGRATPADARIELAWTQAAAGRGSDEARFALARLIEEGIVLPRMMAAARDMHRRHLLRASTPALRARSAAELKRLNGPARSRFSASGDTVEESLGKAEAGDMEAARELANRLWNTGSSDPAVQAQRSKDARYWMTRAAQAGIVNAQWQLAGWHKHGNCGPKDPAQAAHWYEQAAKQGEPASQVELAKILGDGLGVPADPARALALAQRSAAQNYWGGLKLIARAHRLGLGVPPNPLLGRVFEVLEAHAAGQDATTEEPPESVDPNEVRRRVAAFKAAASTEERLAMMAGWRGAT